MNIVILDGYAANPNDFSWEPLEAFGSLTMYERTKPEEVIARAKDAEILIINKINMTDEVIAQLPKLKYIGILATGYNNIDTESAHKHGIVVCNIPSYSTESVVQMTFAHILNITNQVAHYANQDRATGEAADLKWTKNPDFCYWDTPLPEIAGKTLGIIGLGHIGMRVATVALAFGLHVVAYTSKDETNLPNGIKKASSLNLLLSSSDIVSLHCPLANNNIHFFNFGLQIISHRYLLVIRWLKNHKPRKLGIVQSLTDAVSHVIEHLHHIVCVKKEVEVPRINLFDRTKIYIR